MTASKRKAVGVPRGARSDAIPPRSSIRRPDSSSENGFRDKLKRIASRDLELFLALVEAGSYRKASANGPSVTTIRARLGRMEDELGEVISGRGPKGFMLTPTGDRLVRIASDMRASREDATSTLARARPANLVRIAVTEGLGAYWLGPQLDDLQMAHPELMIDLHCDMDLQDVAGGEFDLAFQLVAPVKRGVLYNRIATMHLMPFASDHYLRSHGVPESIDDWRQHRLVWQKAEQVASHLLPYFTGTEEVGDLIHFTTNSSVAHFRSVARGNGIGFLPTYAGAISRRIRPIDLGLHLKREVFCVINRESADVCAVRAAAEWLQDCFSGERFPWFRDDFIHPRDFESDGFSSDVVRLFDGFVDGLGRNIDID
jgi:DNA-binding transcriptional LysR family regulator